MFRSLLCVCTEKDYKQLLKDIRPRCETHLAGTHFDVDVMCTVGHDDPRYSS